MRGPRRIEQLYAFVAVDPDDNIEGLAGFSVGGNIVPMVAADAKRVDSYRNIAQRIATGGTITICRFEVRTEIEVLRP